jgi:hypothetical protein
MEKEWLATPDPRTRPTHVAADGQRVPLNDKFIVGGHEADHPGDIFLPPEERFNCRCTQGYVMEREAPRAPVDVAFVPPPAPAVPSIARPAVQSFIADPAVDPAMKLTVTQLRQLAKTTAAINGRAYERKSSA